MPTMRRLFILFAGILAIGPLRADLKPLPDADVLAQRLPFEQDTYKQVRDAALAAFAARHPGTNPFDEEARQLVKLGVYLSIWGDYYEEGLGTLAADHATQLLSGPAPDPLWRLILTLSSFAHRHSNDNDDAHNLDSVALELGQTKYPALLKLAGFNEAIKKLLAGRNDPNTQAAVGQSVSELPALVTGIGQAFEEFVKSHPSHLALYRMGHDILHSAQTDEPTLIAIHSAFDHAFAANDPGNTQAAVLDGEFLIQDAWNARGIGWSFTVTAGGNAVFSQHLTEARQTLEKVAAASPKEPGVALAMMTVCLGDEGSSLDELNSWFQKGQQAEGDPYMLAYSKEYYMTPKWHGSDEAQWNFGLECGKSGNWAGKVPLLLEDSIHERAVHQTSLFAQPEIWSPIEQMFRGYLAHYPDSVHYRSLFALEAAFGAHWDVAKEQFTILGNNWDSRICGEATHQRMKTQALAH